MAAGFQNGAFQSDAFQADAPSAIDAKVSWVEFALPANAVIAKVYKSGVWYTLNPKVYSSSTWIASKSKVYKSGAFVGG